MPDSPAARFGSGRSVRRVEDDALLRGEGRFADDVAVADALHVAFLRSPHAHARIVSIDASAAKAMPGVTSVITGADLTSAGVLPIPNGTPAQLPQDVQRDTSASHLLASQVNRNFLNATRYQPVRSFRFGLKLTF